jgi:hypothetical protein
MRPDHQKFGGTAEAMLAPHRMAGSGRRRCVMCIDIDRRGSGDDPRASPHRFSTVAMKVVHRVTKAPEERIDFDPGPKVIHHLTIGGVA